MVKINYVDVDAAGMTVEDYINQKTTFDLSTVAVVINEIPIPSEDRGKVVFKDGDNVRIYSFHAGG